jgi:hypothetical protein
VSTGTPTVVGVVGFVPGPVTVPSTAGAVGTSAGRTRAGAGGVTLSGAWIACNIKQYRYSSACPTLDRTYRGKDDCAAEPKESGD